ncbi:lectin BRA-2-like [Haliotis cracherodii]|uniref:lectin BRA-2-like n=1 Tax=Haliotis cracherodii TaxID=6455 RepID=UPI0039E86C5B
MENVLLLSFTDLGPASSIYSFVPTVVMCAINCVQTYNCISVFYHEETSQCSLCPIIYREDSPSLTPSPGMMYYRPLQKCPQGSIHFATESVCVILIAGKSNFTVANNECSRQTFYGTSYRLITFKTSEKYQEVIKFLATGTDVEGIWTGLSYDTTDLMWKWFDGSVGRVQPWYPSEPNSKGSELCSVLYKPNEWTMHDNNCSAQRSFMCEVELL